MPRCCSSCAKPDTAARREKNRIASQAKAAGLLTSEAIERLVRQAIRKAAAERLIEFGKRLRKPGGPEITEAELESELKAVRAERREAHARSS